MKDFMTFLGKPWLRQAGLVGAAVFGCIFLNAGTAAAVTGYTAPIKIERPGFSASIEVVQESWLDGVWRQAEMPLVLGILLLIGALGGLIIWQQRRLRGLESRMIATTSNNLGKLITDLCDRNKLVRLAAVQQLGALGQLNNAAARRVMMVLSAYLKALCGDTQLRATTHTEIVATLLEMTLLRKEAGKTNPISLDFSGLNFSGLKLVDIDFSDAVLKNAQFRGTELRQVTFHGAALDHADFSLAHIHGSSFAGASLTGTVWQGAVIENCVALSQTEIASSNVHKLLPKTSAPSPEHLARQKQLALAMFQDVQAPQDKSKLH